METTRPSSLRKRAAVLDAAEEVFLADGFAAANMDVVAARSGVSKQTVYAHFGGKEALFTTVVERMTTEAGRAARVDLPEPETADGLPAYLEAAARQQLDVVLQPRLMALRQLVIGEQSRFPALAQAFWETGPARAVQAFAARFARLADRGLLVLDDPARAAGTFNWLVMAQPVNATMLLGAVALPGEAERTRLAREAARIFLAAHAPR